MCHFQKSNFLQFVCLFVYVFLDTCFSHFLTIIAGGDLHFSHESELPVCQTRVVAVLGEAANDAGLFTALFHKDYSSYYFSSAVKIIVVHID